MLMKSRAAWTSQTRNPDDGGRGGQKRDELTAPDIQVGHMLPLVVTGARYGGNVSLVRAPASRNPDPPTNSCAVTAGPINAQPSAAEAPGRPMSPTSSSPLT